MPSAPNYGVTLAHEKPLPASFSVDGSLFDGASLEQSQDMLSPSVRWIEKNLAVTSAHIHGLKNIDIGRVFDAAP